ncbi:hypothetical protein L195_g033911 [Trifolium pratense]|uniref:Uncharacterized protein n=1 Tax=Trifolium pratense TaxID=57577 RepID=A0A2K3LHC6_TRIPR|nr:hypothetical protein L195_g033911 [Trifolium pratense]
MGTGSAKPDIEKFISENDFNLWRAVTPTVINVEAATFALTLMAVTLCQGLCIPLSCKGLKYNIHVGTDLSVNVSCRWRNRDLATLQGVIHLPDLSKAEFNYYKAEGGVLRIARDSMVLVACSSNEEIKRLKVMQPLLT